MLTHIATQMSVCDNGQYAKTSWGSGCRERGILQTMRGLWSSVDMWWQLLLWCTHLSFLWREVRTLRGVVWFTGPLSSSYWFINHSTNELTDTDLFIVPEQPHNLHPHPLQTSWIDHLMEHQGHTDYLSAFCHACPRIQIGQYIDLPYEVCKQQQTGLNAIINLHHHI